MTQARVLKVAEIGDFYRKRTKPQIRLQGKWLAEAGIQPNGHVSVSNPSPGTLVIQIIEGDKNNEDKNKIQQ